MRRFSYLLLLLVYCSQLAFSNQDPENLVIIEGAFSTARPTGSPTGAIYLKLSNHSNTEIKLIAAHSEIANYTELHTTAMDNGIMKMRQVEQITIPAKDSLSMQPGGGYHIMLIGLSQPLNINDTFSVWLSFDLIEEVEVLVKVQASNHPNQRTDQSQHINSH